MIAVLTENLPLLAGAPNGIKKLRELILELAVRGKLVPQDPSDEPASELLKRITEEKARLEAEGKIKRQKLLPEVDEEEKPFGLPDGWVWTRLGELSALITSGSRDWAQHYSDDGAIFVRMGNLSRRSYELRLDNIQRVSPPEDGEGSRTKLVAGDLLLSITGEVGLLGLIPSGFGEAYINQHVCLIRFLEEVRGRYLPEALRSPWAYEQYEAPQRGIKNSFRLGDVSQILVPLPPLEEQDRIVAKVDELMALCDRLEARQTDADSAHGQLVQALLSSLTQTSDAEDFAQSWQRLAEHFHTLFINESSIDDLKQTLLQLAVMGKLVPQDPSDESASELLKRIAEEKARLVTEGKLRKPKARLEISEEEMAFNLPRGWQWVRKADVFNFMNGYAFKSEWFQQKGIRLLRNINVAHGEVDWEESACITEEQAADYQAFSLEEDDVVLTLDRPIISTGLKYAVIRRNDLPCLLLQRVAKISPYAASVTVGYLTTWLKSSFFVGAIDPGRSNGVPHISTTQVASMLFALPPLAEQHRIVAKVDQLMALCDQLKARLNQARQVHEHLASALVEQAVA